MRQIKIVPSITNRESASIEKYLTDINKEERIDSEEEARLAQRIREGDQAALEKLTKANLRFVVSVAKQYQGQGLSLNDLINDAASSSYPMPSGGYARPSCKPWPRTGALSGCR